MAGKSYRKGLSVLELLELFPDDTTAEQWFVTQRWGDEVECPWCVSADIQVGVKHPTMSYRCRDCRRFFSVKTATIMEGSKLGCQKWAIALYLFATNLKGVSSMKLHRELGITQKAAWHLAHRIRKALEDDDDLFSGSVQAERDLHRWEAEGHRRRHCRQDSCGRDEGGEVGQGEGSGD